MANVRTQNRNRMQARAEASGKKPGVPKAKVPMVRPSTDIEGPRGGRGLSSLGEPSSNPIARRASTDIAERVLRGESPGIKDIGSGRSAGARGLPAPSTASAPAAASRGMSGLGRLAGGIGLAAYSPAVGEGSDKPQNYPGEGLKPRAAFPQGSPESSIPAPKKAAPKPVARKPRGSSEDDAFMEDLRASAARMKADTAEAARATGRMKGAMEEFQSATDDATEGYKKGGRVGGRGDGKAIRGRTKGRFI
jgi:hypothetical protein